MTNRLAIITGASSGIGAEFARQFAAQGCDVWLVARRAARLQQLAERLHTTYGITANIHPTDLADHAQTTALADKLRQLPRIDYLVNNAGLGAEQLIAESDVARQLTMLHVHINAPFLLSRAVLPQMIVRRAGAIINVSSIAGFMHGPSAANYCASKAYLTSFSKSLQLEVTEHNIKVQALCPGYTVTEFHDTAWMDRFERANVPGRLWDSAEFVVSHALAKLDLHHPVVLIPGRKNQMIVKSAQSSAWNGLRTIAKRILRRS